MAMDMRRGAARIVGAAEAFLAAIARFDPAEETPSDCAAIAQAAAQVENAAGALRFVAGARAVECGAHKEQGVADPALWLARQGGTTGRGARQGLELARSLEAHPETKEALLAGAVSVAQAQEITRAASEFEGAEHDLLEIAKAGDLTKVRDEARELRLSGTKPEDLHRAQLATRRFRHWKDGLGMVCFEGALPPETGIPFVNRIEREAGRLVRAARRTDRPERFEAHAADALVALSAGGAAGQSSRTDLVVVCDLYAWRRGHAHPGEPCQVIGGGPIPVELARALAQDAFLKLVLHDGVDIQKIHHVGRRYTAHLRTALDLGPVPAFSGRACVDCARTFGLQHDHDDPVAHTGPTSVSNVKARCVPCHAAKTERDRKAGLLGPRARARAPGTAAPTTTPRRRTASRRAPPSADPP